MNDPRTCKGCQYFRVTFDRSKPWGCEAYAFKSKIMPYIVVFNSVGTDCAAYQQKVLTQVQAPSRTTGAFK
jgi:hypothetical protein